MANTIELLIYLTHCRERVERCIKSILEHTPRACPITFIGEGMPINLAQYVENRCRQAGRNNIKLINHTTCLGYNEQMLCALKNSVAHYVILTNDHVIVYGSWISKLLACLSSEPCLGIVCPFVSGGVRQGLYPVLPSDISVKEIHEYVDRNSKRAYPRITSADTCLLIKRDVLKTIGIEKFRIKVGLEPEICHIARKHGFNVAIADDLFVGCDKTTHYPFVEDDEKFFRTNPLTNLKRLLIKTQGNSNYIAPNTIKIFSPSDKDLVHGKWWGDYWAREHLKDSFKEQNWEVKDTDKQTRISLLLRGSEHFSNNSPIKMVWIYSHPEKSSTSEYLSEFKYVYTLSQKHAEILKKIRPDVRVLWPATSKTYKRSTTDKVYDVLIVGNAAKSRRVHLVKQLIGLNRYRVGVVGSAWENHIDPRYIIAPYWDNERYTELFNQAHTTIYIHADNMRELDFVAIRVLDIIASSDCLVICDKNEGLNDLGLGDIPQFSSFEDLQQHIDDSLSNPEKCLQKTREWRQIIRKCHTFGHRVEQIIDDIEERPRDYPVVKSTQRSVAVYLSTMHSLCYNMNIKFASAITDSFKELGFEAQLIHDPKIFEENKYDIVFCAAPSFQHDFRQHKQTTYIMYQSEQCPREDVFVERAHKFWEVVSRELPKYDIIFEPFENHISYFKKLGYDNVVHFRVGYHPSFELNCPCTDDYDVAFVGHPAGTRMRRYYILSDLEQYFKDKRIRYYLPTLNGRWGGITGEAYTKLLLSTRISLNIHYTPIRYFEYHKLIVDSFCNRRFVISEEIECLSPFIPGKHIVICNANEFEDKISYYLSHDKERQKISESVYNFVKTDFTLTENLRRSLEEADLL